MLSKIPLGSDVLQLCGSHSTRWFVLSLVLLPLKKNLAIFYQTVTRPNIQSAKTPSCSVQMFLLNHVSPSGTRAVNFLDLVLVFVSVKFHLTRSKSVLICLGPISVLFHRNLLCPLPVWLLMSWPEELMIWVFSSEAFPTVNEAWELGIFCSPCGPHIKAGSSRPSWFEWKWPLFCSAPSRRSSLGGAVFQFHPPRLSPQPLQHVTRSCWWWSLASPC